MSTVVRGKFSVIYKTIKYTIQQKFKWEKQLKHSIYQENKGL